ncbi:hypothetical protein Hypma_002906 [Hypsizygus marmoreus]|uniref:F-box domain-containing protein n=1 Tax=Hypsizygus marmoreus TaxID=39966 RepID=A0A369J5H8_HYPMA|nr:hypothetical protein Hypma_002906 [Hypsizygus marmoreus]
MPALLDAPEDIIVTILEELRTDRPTLRACTLVARSFRSPCQRLLFSMIGFDYLQMEHSRMQSARCVQRLHAVLITNPLLGLFVRELNLMYEFEAEASTDVLRLLPRLRTLAVETLAPRHWSKPSVPWESFPPNLRSGIGHLMQLPSLENVDLRGISGFPVFHFPIQLRHLTLSRVQLHKSIASAMPVISLRSLRFKRLPTQSDIDNCQLVLQMAANTLERLQFSVGDPALLVALDLSPVKLLATLKVVYVSISSEFILAHLRMFVDKSIPTVSALREFTLSFDSVNPDWSSVDRTLSGAAHLSGTHIHIHFPKYAVVDALERILEARMPRIVKRDGTSIYGNDELVWTRCWNGKVRFVPVT